MKENFWPKEAILMPALPTSSTAITQFNQWEVDFESDFSQPKMQAGTTSQTTFLDFSCKIYRHQVITIKEKGTTFFQPATDYASAVLNIPETF